MKILLTGANGFLGGHLLERLVSKYTTKKIIVLTSKNIPGIKCEIYKNIKDFGLDKNIFQDITHLIHAGAFTPKSHHTKDNLCETFSNIEFTKNLLLFNFNSLKRIINISSTDVYKKCSKVISENSLIEPISLYGSSKLFCERMIKIYSIKKNVSFINLRLGNIYGPGEQDYKKILPMTIKNLINNLSIEVFGDGSQKISFIYVYDVVRSILNSLNFKENNIDINVVSGKPVTINELMELIEEISNKKLNINYVEPKNSIKDIIFDNKFLLRSILKNETKLKTGIKKEYEFFKGKN